MRNLGLMLLVAGFLMAGAAFQNMAGQHNLFLAAAPFGIPVVLITFGAVMLIFAPKRR